MRRTECCRTLWGVGNWDASLRVEREIERERTRQSGKRLWVGVQKRDGTDLIIHRLLLIDRLPRRVPRVVTPDEGLCAEPTEVTDRRISQATFARAQSVREEAEVEVDSLLYPRSDNTLSTKSSYSPYGNLKYNGLSPKILIIACSTSQSSLCNWSRVRVFMCG